MGRKRGEMKTIDFVKGGRSLCKGFKEEIKKECDI